MPNPILLGSQVNLTPVSGAQDGVTSTTLTDGRAVVAWRDGNSTIKYEILNVDGSIAQAERPLNQVSTGNIGAAFDAQVQLASLSTGGFVAVWNWRQSLDSVHYMVYDAFGNVVKAETELQHPVNVTTFGAISAAMDQPTVTGTANGDFIIAFHDGEDTLVTTVAKVYTQLITKASGYSALTSPPVEVTSLYSDYRPSIAYAGGSNTNTNLVFESSAGWTGTIAQFPSRSGVWGGIAGFDLYRVDQPTTSTTTSSYVDTNPDIAYSSDFRHFMVAWTANGLVKASVDGNGAGTFVVSSATNTVVPPKVVSVNGGGFLVLWCDGGSSSVGQAGYDVVGRLYDSTGTATSSQFVITSSSVVNNSMQTVEATALSDGRMLVTWTASGPSSNGIDVYSQMIKVPTAVGGSFQVSGASSLDTAIMSGSRGQYTVTNSAGGITVTDSVSGRDGSAVLTNVEQVKFSDITLVFDLQSSQDKLVYELYQAAYGRTPDLTGYRYWAVQADSSGLSAQTLASAFISAPEFRQKYGSPDNAGYVTALYSNVLGRTPDQSGLNFWIDQANKGESRTQLLVDFATSGENVTLIAPHVSNGYWLI